MKEGWDGAELTPTKLVIRTKAVASGLETLDLTGRNVRLEGAYFTLNVRLNGYGSCANVRL